MHVFYAHLFAITFLFLGLYIFSEKISTLGNLWSYEKANKIVLLEHPIVHYVRLIPENPEISGMAKPNVQSPFNTTNQTIKQLNFLDCMSILSVQINLRPAAIYVHNNIPSSYGQWLNAFCNRWIKDWSNLRLIPIRLKNYTAGQKIKDIQHEADIAKLEAVYRYGGLVIDFDVYILNGTLLRHKLATSSCLSCHENPGEYNDRLNAGFLGCLEPKAEFPKRVLEVYRMDYRPKAWAYNSGEQPFRIMQQYPHSVTLDDWVCNEPEWIRLWAADRLTAQNSCFAAKSAYQNSTYYFAVSLSAAHIRRHMDLYENDTWKNMMAYHSYFHMGPGIFSVSNFDDERDFEATQIYLLTDVIRSFAVKAGIVKPQSRH